MSLFETKGVSMDYLLFGKEVGFTLSNEMAADLKTKIKAVLVSGEKMRIITEVKANGLDLLASAVAEEVKDCIST